MGIRISQNQILIASLSCNVTLKHLLIYFEHISSYSLMTIIYSLILVRIELIYYITIILTNINCRLIWIERLDIMKNYDKQKGVICLKDTGRRQCIQETRKSDQHFTILDRAVCF